MPTRDDKPPSLADLDRRLREAREAHAPPAPSTSQRQFGLAYRVFVELLAGVLVGGVLGWWFDQWLGTRPWLLIVMLALGFGAGMSNVIKVVRRLAAEADNQGGQPPA